MDIETAKQAGEIAAQIDGLLAILGAVDQLLKEPDGWELVECRVRARETGASQPGGAVVNLLPFGPANAKNTGTALQNAKATYQAALDALMAQMAGL